jgi:hypothetical protein
MGGVWLLCSIGGKSFRKGRDNTDNEDDDDNKRKKISLVSFLLCPPPLSRLKIPMDRQTVPYKDIWQTLFKKTEMRFLSSIRKNSFEERVFKDCILQLKTTYRDCFFGNLILYSFGKCNNS